MLNKNFEIFFKDKEQDRESLLNEYYLDLQIKYSDWLQPIHHTKVVGEDPTYNDQFQFVKEEIARLSGINHQLIIEACEQLLKNECKDIRVITYYCWSKLQVYGIEGFAEGIELLAIIVDTFKEEILPSRSNVRKNAIEWLSSAKFIDELNNTKPININVLQRIIFGLLLLKNNYIFLFKNENDHPNLETLITFFSNSIHVESTAKTTEVTQEPSNKQANDQNTSPVDLVASNVKTYADVLEQVRRVANFLKEKTEGHLSAGRLVRNLRWDMIINLPVVDGKNMTKLPPPRLELKTYLSNLLQQQNWQELFEKSEELFMESANHFWFDLQYYSIIAMKNLGIPFSNWVHIYLSDIRIMLNRLKGIELLKYSDGTPFANEQTLQWLHVIANEPTQDNNIHDDDKELQVENIDVSLVDLERQAVKLAKKEKLSIAFKWLQANFNVQTVRDRFLLTYIQAKVAKRVGEQDIAFKIFKNLNQQQLTIKLTVWEPKLLFSIKEELLNILQYKIKLNNKDKPELEKQLEIVQQELMDVDPLLTVNLLTKN